jgi:hypothetical protein
VAALQQRLLYIRRQYRNRDARRGYAARDAFAIRPLAGYADVRRDE